MRDETITQAYFQKKVRGMIDYRVHCSKILEGLGVDNSIKPMQS